ncbi:MAG: undecaprenyl diphosphate synthase family protein [Candidatus Nanoarchaeia archaeon]
MYHIGFIMDGNRRFSKQYNLNYKEGYTKGMLQFFNVIKWQVERQIKTTSFYALSLDNAQKRSRDELESIKSIIMQLLEDPQFEQYCIQHSIKLHLRGRYFKDNHFLKNVFDTDLKQFSNNIQAKMLQNQFSKNQELLEYLQTKISIYEEKLQSAHNLNQSSKTLDQYIYHVNIALFYDGVDEIVTTTQHIARKVKNNELNIEDISKEVFQQESYFPSTNPPEIIVRTGNAPRISGFMLFLSAYSEIYLTPKLWPELEKKDLDEILTWFSKQSRNFGK